MCETVGMLKISWTNISKVTYYELGNLVNAVGEKCVLDIEVVPNPTGKGDKYIPMSIIATFITDAYEHPICAYVPPYHDKAATDMVVKGTDALNIPHEQRDIVTRIIVTLHKGSSPEKSGVFMLKDVSYCEESDTIIIQSPPVCTYDFLHGLFLNFAGVVRGVSYERVLEDGNFYVLMGIALSFSSSKTDHRYYTKQDSGSSKVRARDRGNPY
jgi:hypothetical protein